MTRFSTAKSSFFLKMFMLMVVALMSISKIAVAQEEIVHFDLFPNPGVLDCLRARPDIVPTAKATIVRTKLNDTLFLDLRGIKPGLKFDLFTVQNSNQTADGSLVPGFLNFGLAWYQSDIEIADRRPVGRVMVKTILLDQIFGFDPAVALPPTNTFHLGFWFNNPKDAGDCVDPSKFTPFNGEHHAGPLAMISRPNPDTNLGPLCTNPDTSKTPAVCNP